MTTFALPPEFCRALIAGGAPRLAFDARELCPLEVGQEFELTSRLGIRLTKRSRTRKGEVVFTYTILDNRDRYLRASLPTTSFEADEDGNPKQPTAEAIRRAAEESAYDGNPRDPVDAGRVVDPEYQRELDAEAEQMRLVQEQEKIGARIGKIQDLPPLERVLALTELSKERGIDPRSDLKALERRLQRRLGLAA